MTECKYKTQTKHDQLHTKLIIINLKKRHTLKNMIIKHEAEK